MSILRQSFFNTDGADWYQRVKNIMRQHCASLCPLGHGGLYETPPSKKGIVSRWFMAFCPTTLSLQLQVEGIKSIKLLSLLGKN